MLYEVITKKTSGSAGGLYGCDDRETGGVRERKKYRYLNLGMIPLNGIEQPDNPAEQLIKYASRRIGSFKHYQTLRDFKEKYATIWENKYMIFENDFDLLQIPGALRKAMRPEGSVK